MGEQATTHELRKRHSAHAHLQRAGHQAGRQAGILHPLPLYPAPLVLLPLPYSAFFFVSSSY